MNNLDKFISSISKKENNINNTELIRTKEYLRIKYPNIKSILNKLDNQFRNNNNNLFDKQSVLSRLQNFINNNCSLLAEFDDSVYPYSKLRVNIVRPELKFTDVLSTPETEEIRSLKQRIYDQQEQITQLKLENLRLTAANKSRILETDLITFD